MKAGKGIDSKELQQKILSDGQTTSVRKHLKKVGNYVTELRGKEVAPWVEKARKVGVKEDELADVGYVCILQWVSQLGLN